MNKTAGTTLAALLLSLPLLGCDDQQSPDGVGPVVERGYEKGDDGGDDDKTLKTIDEPLYTNTTFTKKRGGDFMFAALDDGTGKLLEEFVPMVRFNFEQDFAAGFAFNEEVAASCSAACEEVGLSWEGALSSEALEFGIGTAHPIETEAGLMYEYGVETYVETRCTCQGG